MKDTQVTAQHPAHRSPQRYDVAGAIIEYENGELEENSVTELFQHLLDSGMIYHLQGSYQRTASAMLDAGIITGR